MLKNDFNTNGHTQWYFFSVGNTRKDVTYKFTIGTRRGGREELKAC